MDEQLRHLGRAARAQADAEVDVDRAWASFGAELASGVSRTQLDDETATTGRNPWPWLGVAAAAVALVGGLVLLRDDNDTITTTDVPDTTGQVVVPPTPVPTTVTPPQPSTTPPTTTAPTTTAAPTTAVVPPVVGSWRDFPSEGSSIGRSCLEGSDCTQIELDPAGTSVSYDPVSRTLTRHSIPPVNATVPAEWGQVWIEFAGPDDVVYLNIQTGVEYDGAIVAVSLSGGDAGREIARWPGSDRVGDADLVATPDGIVNVGCCGEERQRPEPTDVVEIPWVDRDGKPITSPIPTLQLDWEGDSLVVTRGDRSWTFVSLGDYTLRGMSITPTFDGGVMAQLSSIGGAPMIALRGWPDGSIATQVVDEFAAVLEPAGTVVFGDGERFARVQLFADRADRWGGRLDVDLTDWSVSAVGLNDLLDTAPTPWANDPITFADAVTGSTAANETRSIRVLSDDGTRVLVEVITANYRDDSVFAGRYQLTLERRPDNALRFVGGQFANACQPGRGQQDFAAALCV
jgi:hypothetical protein